MDSTDSGVAAGRFASASMMERERALDRVFFALAILVAAVVALAAARADFGRIPDQNALFSADTGRVFANLSGDTEGYYRLKVHPLYGWFCIFYQNVAERILHVPPWIGIPLLAAAITIGCAALLYLVLRRMAVAPFAALSFTTLFCSTGTYVFWSTLPETHMAGGASVLVAVLVMTGRGARTVRGELLRSAAALAAGFSMVITDGMVWVLKEIDYRELRRGALRRFVSVNLARAKPLLRRALWGVGITVLLWAPQWAILGKRAGIPFNFLEERHYVEVAANSWYWALHIFGVMPPGSWATVALAVSCVAVLAAALAVLETELWYIPLFPLFGLALHSVYSGDSAFLFSPDYLPLFIVSFALVAKARLPAWFPAAVLAASMLLVVVNLHQWHEQLAALAASGQLKTFATVTLH